MADFLEYLPHFGQPGSVNSRKWIGGDLAARYCAIHDDSRTVRAETHPGDSYKRLIGPFAQWRNDSTIKFRKKIYLHAGPVDPRRFPHKYGVGALMNSAKRRIL
jgi:hypothetical protein